MKDKERNLPSAGFVPQMLVLARTELYQSQEPDLHVGLPGLLHVGLPGLLQGLSC